MVEQARGLRSNPGLMLIDDADKAAKWYFALKQRRLTSRGPTPSKPPPTSTGAASPHDLAFLVVIPKGNLRFALAFFLSFPKAICVPRTGTP